MNRPLPVPEESRLFLSFDFDGTLHEPSAGLPLRPEFFAEIERLRRDYGALWAINTGRSLFQMVQGFNEAEFPFAPDYLIAREREIYQLNAANRWVDMGRWNADCEKAHRKLFRKSRRVLNKLRTYVETETAAKWIDQKDEPAGVIATSSEEMQRISEKADELCAKSPNLGHERNTIYMRFSHVDYNKGTALRALADAVGIGAEQTFAVGDGHNDLTKLRSDVAKYLAAPSNAVTEVQHQVSENGGHLASQPASAGTIEALQQFFPDPPIV